MNVVSGYAKQTTTSLTMNDKVRYIKISFSNNKINGIKISNLRFYNSSSGEVFNYPENVYFSFDGLSVENPKALLNDSGSATVIECTESGGSIIIDFGRNSLLLNTYNKMSLHVDASNVRDVASSMTIYASVDGEDYA